MRTHDIVCVSDGWAYQLNGVEIARFPSWQIALTAARRAAELESRQGLSVALRYGGLDGELRDVQTREKRGFGTFGSQRLSESDARHAKMSDRPETAPENATP